jgi:hypothetical protein
MWTDPRHLVKAIRAILLTTDLRVAGATTGGDEHTAGQREHPRYESAPAPGSAPDERGSISRPYPAVPDGGGQVERSPEATQSTAPLNRGDG